MTPLAIASVAIFFSFRRIKKKKKLKSELPLLGKCYGTVYYFPLFFSFLLLLLVSGVGKNQNRKKKGKKVLNAKWISHVPQTVLMNMDKEQKGKKIRGNKEEKIF